MIEIQVDAFKVRNIANQRGNVSLKAHFTIAQAESFLQVHGDQMQDKINAVIREFIRRKLE